MLKLLKTVFFVIVGGLFFAFIGFMLLANYGGDNCDQPPEMTCNCFCCESFGVRGYESCGQLGIYLGAIVGAVAGFFISTLHKDKDFIEKTSEEFSENSESENQ